MLTTSPAKRPSHTTRRILELGSPALTVLVRRSGSLSTAARSEPENSMHLLSGNRLADVIYR
jgi:hypothetical protein